MARIGVCEDDPGVLRVVEEALAADGHDVVVATTGAEALRRFQEPGFKAIVLDIGLPDSDGRDVCQALRAVGVAAPVLFLTARGGLHEVVAGFAAGGDDYLVKPFAVPELRARVGALVRRAPESVPAPNTVRLDPEHFSVRFEDREARLTPTEFRILAALLGRPGVVLRRQELVASAWPYGAQVNENTLDSYMRRLRQRLQDIGAEGRIETVRGVGYALT
ncbi:response regulator transcription factor [Amnibacterium sp.]|uniref:response regulator transcription factor n=1 Tax=Amnibacterium sp. TaxID=1872496 RepID=UPI00260BCF64|nr:response regulator transcription factor [Amnibacterium sp.]MCU1473531.1 DNA-binding response regulator [Amnibacterium sp.]